MKLRYTAHQFLQKRNLILVAWSSALALSADAIATGVDTANTDWRNGRGLVKLSRYWGLANKSGSEN